MRSLTLAMTLLASLTLTRSVHAQTVVLDFEDRPSGLTPVPAGYGGVASWGSWASYRGPNPNYPPASGTHNVYSVGGQQSIVFGQDVVFEGANVVSALPFSWQMFYQGQVVATSAVLTPNTGGPAVWLASGYTGLVDSLRYVSSVNVHGVDDFTYTIPTTTLGTNYCGPAVANSTGASAVISGTGSLVVADNNFNLTATALPQNAFAFFITSQTQGNVPMAGGGAGTICLGGAVGRSVGNAIINSGATGVVSVLANLNSMPQPTGPVAVMVGETWNFQCWYRDAVGGAATSNFTDGLSVTFQ
ncbi:MAG: hypothetical protein R3F49_06670 [Planctomycetota bacterium]